MGTLVKVQLLLMWGFPSLFWGSSFYSQMHIPSKPLGLDNSSFSTWQRRWIYSEEIFPIGKWQPFRKFFLSSFLFQCFFLFSFIDTDEDTVKRCFATFEEKFFQTCEKELAKINIFYSGKVLICVYLWKIRQHKRSLKLPDFQNSHSVHEGLPSGNYRACLYGRLLRFNHRCGTKTMVFEWRKNEGQAISLLCNSILLNFEDALKFKWQLTYRAQFLSLPMVAVYCACFRHKCKAP